MTVRALSELFSLAAGARERDAVDRGAVGADGYGFALADQFESERYLAGGRNVANLPSFTEAGLTAHVLGLVGGRVQLHGHVEELFALTLCAVSPDGRRHVFMFYHGPSGHALGAGFDHGLEPDEAESLAAAWERALRKAPTVDFQLQVGSDFGRYWLVVRKGKAHSAKRREPDVPLPPALVTDDLGALEAALARAESAEPVCDRFDELYTAWRRTSESARKKLAREYRAKIGALWRPALDEVEAALAEAARAHAPLPAAVERVAPVALFPETFRIDNARQSELYDRWRSIALARG